MGVIAGANINDNGLIFSLDAANFRSYSGSGLTSFGLVGGIGGTLVNGVGFTSVNSGSFIFDGSNDYIRIEMVPILRPTSQITVEVWANLTNASVNQHFIALQYNNLTDNSYVMYYIPPYVRTIIGNGSQNMISYSASLTAGSWYYLVQTYDGSNQRLYINGTFAASNPCTGNILYNSLNDNLLIGSDYYTNYSQGLNAFLNGKLSSAKIYNRALTAKEIKQNYNATKRRYGL
jgi:hypothetical protein